MGNSITNYEMIQIMLEAMGGAFCLVCIVALLIYGKTKITNTIRQLLMLNALTQLCDICSYIFRGNLETFSIVISRISNYFLFVFQIVMLLYSVRLTIDLLNEYGIVTGKKLRIISFASAIAAFLLMTINLFTGIAYYFDENNYYHRNTGWYFYCALFLIVMLSTLICVVVNWKKIERSLRIGIIVYILIPVISALLQAFYYGISLNNLAVTVSLMIILFIHMKLARTKNMRLERNDKNKSLLGTIMMFSILAVTMSISMVYNVSEIQNIADDLSHESTYSIFYKTKNDVENELFKPIAVADALAENVSLKRLFDPEITSDNEDVTEEVVSILNSMNKAFGYTMMFASSEYNGGYYTYLGLSRIMDRDNDPNERWYNDFINSHSMRELNIDTDKDNDMALSVFVNRLMLSDDGRTLGICGVGIDLSYICEKIRQYEEEKNIKIYLVNPSGLIMLCSDIDKIEVEYLQGFDTSRMKNGETVIVDTEEGTKIGTYIENFGWYLVMEDKDIRRVDVSNIILFCVLIFVAGVSLMALVFGIMFSREKNVTDELEMTRALSQTDKLTGLGNRRGYDYEIYQIYNKNKLSNLIIVMMDVNGLKHVNDTLGHDAGDELLCGAAHCISKAFCKDGKVFRIGGDEFVAILQCDKNKMPELLEKFEYETNQWKGDKVKELNISVGYTCSTDYPELSFDELERKADEEMYQAKSLFYLMTGRDRRKS